LRSSAPGGVVDTHVHIFQRDCAMIAGRRYTPDYDATAQALLAQMEASGVARAVLVQPSFLGTDNRFLLDAIAASGGRFSGIAVVEPDIGAAGLGALRRAGVRGVRLNCIGRETPDLAGADRALVDKLADLGMALQVQAEAGQWTALEGALSHARLDVIIDHFGRTPIGHASGGFEALLRAAARSPRIWFKFSGPYRFGEAAAGACAAAISQAVGIERIIWGSDWPHTQFEERCSYAETRAWLTAWLPDAAERERVLVANPAQLFDVSKT
jgi:predicted TIM-barrel fold metal-dependent hydrolase